jgi:hypothetical protein
VGLLLCVPSGNSNKEFFRRKTVFVKQCVTFAVIGQTVAVSEQVSRWYVLNGYCMPVELTCVVEYAVHVDYVSALQGTGNRKNQPVF